MNNITTVTITGQLPRVSSFIDSFKDEDVKLDVKKDKTQGDLEEYEVNVTYDPEKVDDPILVIKKYLPDNLDLMSTVTHSQYYGFNDDLVHLKDSIPNYISFDWYPDKLKILGKDLYSAINEVKASQSIESNSLYVNAFIDISNRLLFGDVEYSKFSKRNHRDVHNLYTLAYKDLMEEGQSNKTILFNILIIALDAIFDSVEKGKQLMSTKIMNPAKRSIAKMLKDSEYDYNKVVLVSRVEVPKDNASHPKSEYFISEVNKKLDGISDRPFHYYEQLYYDALNEAHWSQNQEMIDAIDKMWELSNLHSHE